MPNISSYFFIPREGTDFSDLFKRVRIMPLYPFPHFKDLNHKITEHKNRFFIHLDFDAFFAQVEQRDNPKLRGQPVSVGGLGGNRGIVMTASYEARRCGVDTGTSVLEARKLCPDLISLPCYGPKYEFIMHNIQNILRSFVPEENIEQYSIDECFVDITPVVKDFTQAWKLALRIKKKIRHFEHLTSSLGVSFNKTYAKMATGFKKPDGLTIITQNDRHKIYRLHVKKMWGIGARIAKRLGAMNITTLGELASSSIEAMRREFGVNGIVFRKLARGEDTSEIFKKTSHEKCLNHHHTLSENIYKADDVKREIRRMGEYICRKLRSKELVAGYLYLTIRFDNLRYAGDEIRLKRYTNDDREIYDAAIRLYKRLPHPNENHKARMFGMSVFDLHTDQRRNNLELFERKVSLPYYELDKLKHKYGEGIIRVGIKN